MLPFFLFFAMMIASWGQYAKSVKIDSSLSDIEIANLYIDNMQQIINAQEVTIKKLIDSVEYLQHTANIMLWATIVISFVFVIIVIFMFIEEFRLWKKV